MSGNDVLLVVLILAQLALTTVTQRYHGQSAAIYQELLLLVKTGTQWATQQALAPPAGGGQQTSFGPLSWLPAWSQTLGRLPDGNPDPQAYSDCGETCCAMIVAAVHGVPVEPGALRQYIGGVQRSGLTNAGDLVAILELCHVAATASADSAAEALVAVRSHWANAQPVIVLGTWLSTPCLHWEIAWSWSATEVGMLDPWTGRRVTMQVTDWLMRYAGEIVAVGAQCHYDMHEARTPGS